MTGGRLRMIGMIGDAGPAQRKPKDRDFIETREGFLFCVAGYLHPPDKYTAYLKYSPASEGRWRGHGTAYHRELAYYHAHQVSQTLDFLREHYPHYVHHCPVRDMLFSMIPRDLVRSYYCPELRLPQLRAGPRDPLEEEIARLADAIHCVTGISQAELGITGSVLLGIHDPSFSDIDLIVYGRGNARILRAQLSDAGRLGISTLDEPYVDGWSRRVMQQFELTYRQARWLVYQQWKFSDVALGNRVVSLHPTRSDAEIEEDYGDHLYRDVGMATLQATISCADDAVFLPAVYRVEAAAILDGPPREVTEIWANEGLFGQVGDAGQRVEARGKLEEVDGGPRHRLVVGSSSRAGQEYLLPVGL
jgi:uncharacterized protein